MLGVSRASHAGQGGGRFGLSDKAIDTGGEVCKLEYRLYQ
jgi:hypothetical protein